MSESFFWDSYLSNSYTPQQVENRRTQDWENFQHQRRLIDTVVSQQHPQSIAIMGAGFLNDIPLDSLVGEASSLYFLDWLSEPVKIGLSRSIIAKTENTYKCLFCRKGSGALYCRNFTGEFVEEGVCTGFEKIAEPYLGCRNYETGEQPSIIRTDLTGNIARSFASKIEKNISSYKSPKDAFVKALRILANIKPASIPVEKNSMDLVTSSMIISQFEFEPYGYFATLLERRFGRDEIIRNQKILTPLMEDLRARLFIAQVDAHLKEMKRIARKDGQARLYLSAELLRSEEDRVRHFLVQGMARVLEIIGTYFDFSFEYFDESTMLTESKLNNGRVVNLNLVLIPKDA